MPFVKAFWLSVYLSGRRAGQWDVPKVPLSITAFEYPVPVLCVHTRCAPYMR